MGQETDVQWPDDTGRGKVWSLVSDPLEIAEAVIRVATDLPIEDAEFLAKTALKRQWTRKSVAESLLALQVKVLRDQYAELIDAVGSLPDAEDQEAMRRYAKRAAARDAKLDDK